MESRETLVLELVWEYNYTPEEAEEIVSSYLDSGNYALLYDILKHKSVNKILAYKEAQDV